MKITKYEQMYYEYKRRKYENLVKNSQKPIDKVK